MSTHDGESAAAPNKTHCVFQQESPMETRTDGTMVTLHWHTTTNLNDDHRGEERKKKGQPSEPLIKVWCKRRRRRNFSRFSFIDAKKLVKNL